MRQFPGIHLHAGHIRIRQAQSAVALGGQNKGIAGFQHRGRRIQGYTVAVFTGTGETEMRFRIRRQHHIQQHRGRC